MDTLDLCAMIPKEAWDNLSDAQKTSAVNQMERQGKDNFSHAWYDTICNCFMMQFSTITIGIEPDGYAHS